MILLLLLSLSLLLLSLIIFWMPVFCVLIYSVSEIPTLSTKKGRFKDWHSCSHEQWRHEPLAPPVKNFELCASKTFWDHKWMQTLHKVKTVQCITTSKIIAGSCLDPAKGKNGWETPEKRQRIVLQRLVNKEVLKTGKMLSKNGGPEMIAENGRFLAKTGGLESLVSFHCKELYESIVHFRIKKLPLNTNINGTFIQG